MIEILQTLLYGFLFAMWAGMLLGLLIEWNSKLFLLLMIVFGFVIIGEAIFYSPSTVVQSMNWIFVIGTIPGYLFGELLGQALYKKVFDS